MSDDNDRVLKFGDREIELPDWPDDHPLSFGVDPATNPPAIMAFSSPLKVDIPENPPPNMIGLHAFRFGAIPFRPLDPAMFVSADADTPEPQPDYVREDGMLDLDAYHESPEWEARRAELERGIENERIFEDRREEWLRFLARLEPEDKDTE